MCLQTCLFFALPIHLHRARTRQPRTTAQRRRRDKDVEGLKTKLSQAHLKLAQEQERKGKEKIGQNGSLGRDAARTKPSLEGEQCGDDVQDGSLSMLMSVSDQRAVFSYGDEDLAEEAEYERILQESKEMAELHAIASRDDEKGSSGKGNNANGGKNGHRAVAGRLGKQERQGNCARSVAPATPTRLETLSEEEQLRLALELSAKEGTMQLPPPTPEAEIEELRRVLELSKEVSGESSIPAEEVEYEIPESWWDHPWMDVDSAALEEEFLDCQFHFLSRLMDGRTEDLLEEMVGLFLKCMDGAKILRSGLKWGEWFPLAVWCFLFARG